MAKNWWLKLEYRIWQSDPLLSQCSLATRGFWLEILCTMHAQEVGTLVASFEQLGRITRCDASEAAKCVMELKATKAADVTVGHGLVTLVSRRLQRVVSARKGGTLRKQKERVTKKSQHIVNSKELSSKKEEEEESKPPAAARDEIDLSPPVDLRKNHPALITIQSITRRYPPKEIWDDIIDHVGSIDLDAVRMRKCFVTWVGRGFNRTNYDWLFDWYINDRIPTAGKAQGGKYEKRTNTDALAEWAAFNAKANADRILGEQKQIGTGLDDPWPN